MNEYPAAYIIDGTYINCRSGDLGIYEIYIYILYARRACKSAIARYIQYVYIIFMYLNMYIMQI